MTSVVACVIRDLELLHYIAVETDNMERDQHTRKRDKMDGETAMSFAMERFQQLHTRDSCPQWLSRCTTIGFHWDDEDNYTVSFAVTPKETNDAESYFKVVVNPETGETQVLLDRGLSAFSGEDLQGY